MAGGEGARIHAPISIAANAALEEACRGLTRLGREGLLALRRMAQNFRIRSICA